MRHMISQLACLEAKGGGRGETEKRGESERATFADISSRAAPSEGGDLNLAREELAEDAAFVLSALDAPRREALRALLEGWYYSGFFNAHSGFRPPNSLS